MGVMSQMPQKQRTCPNCGGSDRYATKVSAGGGYAPNYLPGLNTKGWGTTKFDVVACARCGLTQFFVPEESRMKLPLSKYWTPI